MISDVTDTQELTACALDICRCTLMGPTDGTAYCSDFCQNADEGGIESEGCSCAHPPCDTPQ